MPIQKDKKYVLNYDIHIVIHDEVLIRFITLESISLFMKTQSVFVKMRVEFFQKSTEN